MNERPARIPARSRQQAMDWSLVLLSEGIESTIDHVVEADDWGLLVEGSHSQQAFRVLRQYRVENRGWPWQRQVLRPGLLFDWASLGWALLLLFFFWLQSNTPIRASGMMDSTKVSTGEWWRLFTAVWLHGDAGHLASNLTSGLVLLGLAMGRYGTGAALLAAYLAGALGNVAGWLLADDLHRSLGASGMVMGALGLLSTQSIAFWPRASVASRYLVSGALAGVMLFVLMGLSPDTDVLAHLGGFVGGIVLGAGLAQMHEPGRRGGLQALCGLLFAVLTIVPWWLAISRLRTGTG